jgi:hypothetical protein
VGGPQTEFEPWTVVVEQLLEPLADRQSTEPSLTILSGSATALPQRRFLAEQLVGVLTQAGHRQTPG